MKRIILFVLLFSFVLGCTIMTSVIANEPRLVESNVDRGFIWTQYHERWCDNDTCWNNNWKCMNSDNECNNWKGGE